MVRVALRTLVRPWAVRDELPSVGVAAGIVLLVTLAAFESTYLAGGVLASRQRHHRQPELSGRPVLP